MVILVLIIASCFQLVGAVVYIRSMINDSTKANRVPWLLIALSAFVATGAALYEGARWSALPGFMSGFGPFCIFLASYVVPGSHWKSTWFDYLCGSFSVGALFIWLGLDKGVLALFIAIVADLLACIPLIIKAWRFPETENSVEFLTSVLAATVALFVLESWHFAEWGFPVYLIVMGSILFFAVEQKRFGITRDNNEVDFTQ